MSNLNPPPDYDTAYAAATDGSPFSNSDDGDAWTSHNCDGCHWDLSARTGEGSGCPLLMVALMGRTPAQWKQGDPGRPATRYVCTHFRDEDEVEPEEPVRRPPSPVAGIGMVMPGQDPLEGL